MGVVLALFCSVIQSQPVWAGDDDDEATSDFKDPTIVNDDSSSVPMGVQNLGKKDKKPIVEPVYEKWWFWASAVVVAGVWIAAAVIPGRQKAPGCSTAADSKYKAGCIGDGR